MAHQKLLVGMIGFLVAVAGGVFVLVRQGGEEKQGIPEEAFVAGVEQVIESETSASNEELFEGTIQTEQVVAKPASKPVVKQQIPNPVPLPTPAPVPTPTQSPEPTPLPLVPDPVPLPPQPNPAPEPVSAPKPAGKININTAGPEELDQITGVGPAIAQRIIDYRVNVGLFYTIEDIKNVSGIGDVNFEKMKNEITVGNVSPAPQPPAPQPAPESSPPPPMPPPPSGKININTASFEELQHITGVGEVIAQRIIDYRTQNGQFQIIEDIKNVNGIGDKTFEKMKDEITV